MQRLVLITAIGIGLFLLAVSIQFRHVGETLSFTSDVQPRAEADYYMERTKSRHFDDAGRFDYEYRAKRVEHFVKGDYTLVEQPSMVLFQKEGTPWHVRAEKGRASSGNETVELWDNVRINRVSYDHPYQMQTPALTLKPTQNLATTGEDVVITSPGGRIDATGMNAYVDKNRVELLANVRVQHDPIPID